MERSVIIVTEQPDCLRRPQTFTPKPWKPATRNKHRTTTVLRFRTGFPAGHYSRVLKLLIDPVDTSGASVLVTGVPTSGTVSWRGRPRKQDRLKVSAPCARREGRIRNDNTAAIHGGVRGEGDAGGAARGQDGPGNCHAAQNASELVLCLTNRFAKMRRIFRCRQGAMTSSGVHHARKSNAADGEKDQQICKPICETQH